MPGCKCSGGCVCAVTSVDSDTVSTAVTGNGSAGAPFTVVAEAILVPDGDSPLVGANALKSAANGLYVPSAVLEDVWVVELSDETTAIASTGLKKTIRAPYAATFYGLRGSVNTASSSGVPTVNIKEGGVTVLSTKLTIDVGELTSVTAAAQPVISDATIADDAELTFFLDVAGTGAKGLKVAMYVRPA